VQQASRIVEGLRIGVLDKSEVEEALDVVARGFLDNPVNAAALGEDSERRQLQFVRRQRVCVGVTP
jgi:hypothetical protein